MELLIALIPALPLAGFLCAVLVGARVDRVPMPRARRPRTDDAHGSDARGTARTATTSTTRTARTTPTTTPSDSRPERGGAARDVSRTPVTPTTWPTRRAPMA